MKLLALLLLSIPARAAETLVPVSPPTDWTGVVVAVLVVPALAGIVAFFLNIRKPGIQPGEQAFDSLTALLHKAHDTIQTQAATIEAHAAAQADAAPPKPADKPPAQFPNW